MNIKLLIIISPVPPEASLPVKPVLMEPQSLDLC